MKKLILSLFVSISAIIIAQAACFEKATPSHAKQRPTLNKAKLLLPPLNLSMHDKSLRLPFEMPHKTYGKSLAQKQTVSVDVPETLGALVVVKMPI